METKGLSNYLAMEFITKLFENKEAYASTKSGNAHASGNRCKEVT
jgi:hypothetical protein